MRKHILTILLLLVFLIGLSLLLYPSVSNWWNSLHQSRLIDQYMQNIAEIDQAEYERIMAEANAYNENLAHRDGSLFRLSPEEYQYYLSVLSVSDNGIMGYIEIPAIQVSLPIYHGTEDSVLAVGVGHMESTSLPVGGESSHCVLSGHRGLPSARLFTDLDRLVVNDVFMLHIMDTTLTYEVDKITTTLPHEMSDLLIEEGEDYCTLVTCTPYGINTHRYLVRGHRIDNAKEELNVRVTADAYVIDPTVVAPFAAIPILLLLLVFLMVTTGNQKRRNLMKGKWK